MALKNKNKQQDCIRIRYRNAFTTKGASNIRIRGKYAFKSKVKLRIHENYTQYCTAFESKDKHKNSRYGQSYISKILHLDKNYNKKNIKDKTGITFFKLN